MASLTEVFENFSDQQNETEHTHTHSHLHPHDMNHGDTIENDLALDGRINENMINEEDISENDLINENNLNQVNDIESPEMNDMNMDINQENEDENENEIEIPDEENIESFDNNNNVKSEVVEKSQQIDMYKLMLFIGVPLIIIAIFFFLAPYIQKRMS